MAKKKPAKKSLKIASKPRKTVPAMYPPSEPVQLPPQKIIGFDAETRTITLEGPTPPELLAAVEQEKLRLNLKARLCGYCETCLQRLEPCWGERPEAISRSQWLDQKLTTPQGCVIKLPKDAPAESRDAHLALIAIQWILKCLEQEGPISPLVSRAICMAIDLGQLLQRGQVQIDHGEAVDRGRRNIASTDTAISAKQRESQQKSAVAEAEFNRRMASRNLRLATATLKNMATIKDADGEPKYGSLSQLKRYKKTWKRLTPTE